SARSASLLMGSLCGMCILAGARNLFALFIGLELMSLPVYLLLHGLRPDHRSLEASLKYFFSGALAAGLFLFGMAAYYAGTGSFAIGGAMQSSPAAATGVALMAAAALFKLGAFPFMFWLPDAYEAAETELAAFMATAVKAAAALLLMRVLSLGSGPIESRALPVLAVLTMTVGNLLALRQKDLQRLLAWSSVAHAGYLVAAIWAWRRLGGAPSAAATVYLYLAVYLVSSGGAFLTLKAAGLRRRDDLAGLGARAPLAATLLVVFLLALGGVPPTGGFLAKFFVLWDLWRAGSPALAAAVALNSLIGLGYYMSLVRAVAVDDPLPEPRGVGGTARWGLRAAVLACAAAALCSGVLPGLRAGLEVVLR
ncbi:MAG: NADH-quinone oxidoreductase subunit N, partial [Elusimicrobia bacterium]|nr:NADH-quinone oxidoreductase subunit N [Elusimicrobiota bacterium]